MRKLRNVDTRLREIIPVRYEMAWMTLIHRFGLGDWFVTVWQIDVARKAKDADGKRVAACREAFLLPTTSRNIHLVILGSHFPLHILEDGKSENCLVRRECSFKRLTNHHQVSTLRLKAWRFSSS